MEDEETKYSKKVSTKLLKKPSEIRDEDFTAFVDVELNDCKHILAFKFISQILILLVALGLVVVLTYFLVVFLIKLLSNGADSSFGANGNIAAIVSSIVGYAVVILGIFKIIVEYIFNKDDENNRNQLLDKIINYDCKVSNNEPSGSGSIISEIDELSDKLPQKDNEKKK